MAEQQSAELFKPTSLDHHDGLLKVLLTYWDRSPKIDGVPKKSNFDVTSLSEIDSAIIPHLWVLEMEEETGRFRYRLVGDALISAGALCRVGMYLDDYTGISDLDEQFQRIVERRLPHCRSGTSQMPHVAEIVSLEALITPWCDHEGKISHLINATVYNWDVGYRSSSAF